MRTQVTGLRTAIVVIGFAGLVVGAIAPAFRFIGVALALVCLFVVATTLSQAGRLSAALKPLEGRTVYVEVWGAPLPGASEGALRVQSVRAFGAGLLLWLQPPSSRRSTLLKVAQPQSVLLELPRVDIADAAYVQWAGVRIRRREGVAAFTLSMREQSQETKDP
jgi:hypothetical protein